jgi:hypothetical protein
MARTCMDASLGDREPDKPGKARLLLMTGSGM